MISIQRSPSRANERPRVFPRCEIHAPHGQSTPSTRAYECDHCSSQIQLCLPISVLHAPTTCLRHQTVKTNAHTQVAIGRITGSGHRIACFPTYQLGWCGSQSCCRAPARLDLTTLVSELRRFTGSPTLPRRTDRACARDSCPSRTLCSRTRHLLAPRNTPPDSPSSTLWGSHTWLPAAHPPPCCRPPRRGNSYGRGCSC